MNKNIIISFALVFALVMQMFSCVTIAFAQTDDTDWFEFAKTKGCYIEAGNVSGAKGLAVFDTNRLYDLNDATDASDFDKLGTANTAASLISAGKSYVGGVNNDAALKYVSMTSADSITKKTWMSTKNYRDNGNGNVSNGFIYFKTTDDTITKSDKQLYVVIEYLDLGTANIDMSYITNTGKSADGGTASRTDIFNKTNTNKWLTKTYKIDDACFSSTEISILQSGCEIRINANNNPLYISRVGIIKQSDVDSTGGSTQEPVDPPTDEPSELPENMQTDGIDWFNIAKTKGTYVEAGNNAGSIGMTAHDVNRLYDLNNSTDAAAFNALNTGSTATSLINSGKTYVADKSSDDAVRYTTAKSADNIQKNVWMTTNNYKDRGKGSASGGFIYFKLTNDTIKKTDKNVYIVVEYLESGTTDMSLDYVINTGRSADGGKTTKTPSFKKKNTNKWVTAVIPLNDACFSGSETSILQSGCEIRINASKNPVYISRVGIIKQSDVAPLYDYTYYAPQNQGAAPTLWLVGSSSNENYNLDWFPREGWSMQFEQFFKTKTVTSLKSDGAYQTGSDGYGEIDKVTDGVTIITKAKGGKSTRTFLTGEDPSSGITNDKRWDYIKGNATSGDYILIDLGSNDSSSTRNEVWTNTFSPYDNDFRSYRANLAEFAKVARELKLNVIFITPKCNRTFSNGKIVDGMEAARLSMHDVGRLYGVPVLSVGEEHIKLVEALGTEYSKLIFAYFDETEYPDMNSSISRSDSTHMNNTGALEVCKIIINQLKANKDKYQSVANLYNWVDTSVDTSPITIPHAQSAVVKQDFSNITYTVDGELSEDVYRGEVSVSLDVKNKSDSENTAVLYTAVYDIDDKLIDVSVSAPVTIAPGDTQTLTSDEVTFPGYDGYTFRKFVWGKGLAPYDDVKGGIKLSADGYHRRTVLKWNVDETLADGATYDIYRDDMFIASTKNGAYIDEEAPRGEHAYQINVVDANGKIVVQSGYAIAKVTSIYDLKNTKGVYFSAAHINSKNEAENINHGIKVVDSFALVPAKDAAQHFQINANDHYSDGKYYLGLPFVSKESDASMRVVRAVDANGIVKNAYQTSTFYRIADKKKLNYSCLHFKEITGCENTANHSNYTIFVEYMGKRSTLQMEYVSTTLNANGKNTCKTATASSISQNGEWCIARFDITDAQFADDTPLTEESVIRFKAGDRNLFVSSVLMVNNDICPKTGDQIFAEINNMNFYDSKLKNASKLYPDGISVEFDDGKAVSNGMDVYYSTSGTADNLGEIAMAADGTWYYGTKYIDNNGSAKQSNLFFKVDSRYLSGISDQNAVMEITYKADYDTTIKIGRKKFVNGIGSYSVSWDNFNVTKNTTDNWQTLTVPVSDSWFVNRDNGGTTIRMHIPTSKDVQDRQLKVKKVVIKNANHMSVGVSKVSEVQSMTIHIASDSNAANYANSQTQETGIVGWGMRLGNFFGENVKINNKATAGASTKTFKNMPAILDAINPGDCVLISFYGNDASTSADGRGTTIDEYKANLATFINDIRAKGGIPVIATPKCYFNGSTNEYKIEAEGEGIQPYMVAAKQVADSMGVDFIDVYAKMVAEQNNFTPEEKRGLYIADNVHLTDAGATYVASLIAQGLKTETKVFKQNTKRVPTVYIAAASQSAEYTAEQIEANGMYGWGMFLDDNLSGRVTVVNKGVAGTSTKTFPHFEYIYSNIKEGDYVILGFLYNDSDSSKPERYVTIDQYKENYRNIVANIIKRKGVPVFLTSPPQMQRNTGNYIPVSEATVTPYKEAMKELAVELDVAIVDISKLMYDDEVNLTKDQKMSMYVDEGYNNRLHFTELGAKYVAKLTAKELKNVTNVLSEYITVE